MNVSVKVAKNKVDAKKQGNKQVSK